MNRGETVNETLLSSGRRQPGPVKTASMEKASKEPSLPDITVSTHPARVIGRGTSKGGHPRSALRINLDILQSIRDEGPSKPTRIVLVANLSHDRLARYLEELVLQGLLKENRESAAKSYALTAKGLDFINRVKETQAFLAGFGLEM